MYRITSVSDGKSLGMTEVPVYIKRADNGCYVLCPEPEAAGIVFAGTTYQLLGRESMGNMEEPVMLDEIDAGPMLEAAQELSSDIDGLTVDHEYRLTLLELGLAADSGTI